MLATFWDHTHPAAALAWVEKIEARCLLVATTPQFGQLQSRFGKGVRTSSVGRYVIFHREVADRIEILRVIPGDRNITDL